MHIAYNFFLLFRSESPSQVFIILLQWLIQHHSNLSSNSEGIVLAYDNACNLDRLKAAQNPLPLDKPLDKIWMDIHKIIDVFHFQNHTSLHCKRLYNPAIYKSEHLHWNTQAGEQTFIWLGRFKNIVCSMLKHHHLLYIHRMVLRRNAYTAKCYRNGCKPVLPKNI